MYPAETPGKKQSFGLLPPVPMRMESIPWVKSALVVESPPPKPPRTDRPFNEVHVRTISTLGELCHLFIYTVLYHVGITSPCSSATPFYSRNPSTVGCNKCH